LLAEALESGKTSSLGRLFAVHYESDPQGSSTHAVILIGIALKTCLKSYEFYSLMEPGATGSKLDKLERTINSNWDELRQIVTTRRNSFTSARRFLIAQVLLSAFFRKHTGVPCVLIDLGTGLGVMPRQINSRSSFEHFAPDLRWPEGIPTFQPFEVTQRFGVDRPPLPTMDWVMSCYGASGYYQSLYDELRSTLAIPDVASAEVRYKAIDLIENDAALTQLLRAESVNAVHLSHVLYELSTRARGTLLANILANLTPPYIVLVIEPREELRQRGCTVRVYTDDSAEPMEVCAVSGGHFIGQVSHGPDYRKFISRYQIPFA
jgi:hypothetical protein